MEHFFFDGWMSVLRIIVITIAAYAALIAMLRISGKRTLSKMNAFDFIVTVALGSSLATVSLTKSVPLVDGLLAYALLIGLQALITAVAVRSSRFQQIIAARPALVFYDGQPLHGVLKKERVTMDEIRAAVRQHGFGSMDDVAAIVLETAGELTIIGKAAKGNAGAFVHVEKFFAATGIWRIMWR